MNALAASVLIAHFSLLLLLSLFGLHRISLIIRWLRCRKQTSKAVERFVELPKVTVQIPLYNEQFVARRVVDTVAALDYPKDLLQIQILDDSTDVTSDIIARRVAYHQQKGVPIEHVQRTIRHGYKAGALADAMESATGEFIAIFDADFVPRPSLLLDTIHHFTQSDIAMVQLRWEHLNRHNSRLTETQAMALDAHFSIEQKVRCDTGVLFNFNGTAGIWRASAILDAGNWSADTLTEDLDLSYRAQLRGWRLLYLPQLDCPAELPADMNAFKSQQHRWAKGAIQVMLKLMLKVWRAPMSFGSKLESTFHLANNLAYFVMIVDTLLLLIPSLLIREYYGIQHTLWLDFPLMLMSSGGHLMYFLTGQIALGRSVWYAISKAPAMLLLGIQLALNNARAAAEALLGQESAFIRTPKQGEATVSTRIAEKLAGTFYLAVPPKGARLELLMGLAYGVVLIWAASRQLWMALPFLLLLHAGFLTSGISSIRSLQHSAAR